MDPSETESFVQDSITAVATPSDPIFLESKVSLSWRTRDAAHDLYHRRVQLPSTEIATKTSAKEPTVNYSAQWDADACMARLRRDKASVVRAAFGAAAASVLQALENSVDCNHSLVTATSVSLSSLPPLISSLNQLHSLREESLERAYLNKEYVAQVAAANPRTPSGMSKTTSDGEGKTKAKASGANRSPSKTASSSKLSTPEAVALDSRATLSHAVLCAAASIAVDKLTPRYPNYEVDVKDIPQNKHQRVDEGIISNPAGAQQTGSSSPSVNMGAVLLQAQTLGQRAASLAKNAAYRSTQRYEYRRDNAKNDAKRALPTRLPWMARIAFCNYGGSNSTGSAVESPAVKDGAQPIFPAPPMLSEAHLTSQWKLQCAPRFLSVLQQGAGHALYYDVEWATRYKRIGDLLKRVEHNQYGPHLIVTTQPEVQAFAQEFDAVDSHVRMVSSNLPDANTSSLRVLSYVGSQTQRRQLRERFTLARGLPASSFHVMVTSYSVFFQDYLHLCQLPYQVVLLDDGFAWLSAAQTDPNSSLGTTWENAMWSSSDDHVGLAGTGHKEWDFSAAAPKMKEAMIGLTARHRILTTGCMSHTHRDSLVTAPVPGLLNFLFPHFADVVREEWDRSKIASDPESMNHTRTLLSRSIIVHYPADQHDMHELAMSALTGKLPAGDRSIMLPAPEVVPEEVLISEGKIAYSRRVAVQQWFQPTSRSWLFYELGKASFQNVVDAMKESTFYGHICHEVVTASSTTTSGAGGVVTGSMAYRLGVRCGRKFGSEQGLRQHMAGMHAPPGTWLCRTCGVDCGTSQARTHHERTCGQPTAGGDQGSGATPTVGQGVRSGGSGPAGKKSVKKVPKGLGTKPEDKDSDGSFRVPGYRGIWINASGKHFVKMAGKQVSDDAGNTMLFDSTEEAARKYDEVAATHGKDSSSTELNFKQDGTRIVYEDSAPVATAGLGLDLLGGASSDVVPALSVINIKDLPKDVKPLLRDPRQTSRTGGNSKRHVYAYRGVCRQARKGHDRWQSQISFNGVNHYLGTFDSEWDAAAVYAWAHLILYGEDATKKAQKEGEEAAAAYEQEKKDIAEGRTVLPPPKPTGQKKKKVKKKADEADSVPSGGGDGADPANDQVEEVKKKRKRAPKTAQSSSKKVRTASAKVPSKVDHLNMASLFSKAVVKASALGRRKSFDEVTDDDLVSLVGARLMAARSLRSSIMALGISTPTHSNLRPCVALKSDQKLETVQAGAILMGLSSLLFGWNPATFLATCTFESDTQEHMASLTLSKEYDPNGFNESFRTSLRAGTCVIGRASRLTEEACRSLQVETPLGGTIGGLDCNIGGTSGSCAESAATIQFCPSTGGEFQFCANNDADVVTLNGQRIQARMGSFPLFHGDVCTVGCRVFVFLLPGEA